MKYILGFVAIIFTLIATLITSENLDYVRDCAPSAFKRVGFEIIGNHGYQWGFWGWGGYGGAHVWYTLRKIPDNGITYVGSIWRWGDECHVYGPKAIDAIGPRK